MHKSTRLLKRASRSGHGTNSTASYH